MISTLHIKNIGIIDDLSINLNNGLNILTGETGAGKTLIIDALGIISGERFSKEIIRKGQDFSFVEACIYLPENENSIDGNIIVSREVYSNGRNMCKINGRMVTVNELKKFMEDIIDIHGQHDNQQLLNQSSHIQYLDSYIGKEIQNIKEEYGIYYRKYLNLKNELKNNYGDDIEKQRKLDLLRYQLEEIEKSNLKIGEDEILENEKKIMMNSEKINENLNIADMEISENSIDAINKAIKALEKIEGFDDKYNKNLNLLKGIYYDIQEISLELGNLREENYFDEKEINKVENRLDIIFSLKRKYGNTIEEILGYKEKLKEEIEVIENLEEYTNKLKDELEKTTNKMLEISIKLNTIRKKYAIILSENINVELKELEMKNANVKIEVRQNTNNEFSINGLDDIEFLIRTNIGDDFKSLHKIASGGEMSRIMLAIKKVLSDIDKIPVLIFDEIDTGISGMAAKSVGEKLSNISQKHQVLCITHLASIAAKGDYNYYIYKTVNNENTTTNVKLLNEEEVINEIARIASGEINEISVKHAMSLRKQ